MPPLPEVARLAGRLRSLREDHWPGRKLTQADLAQVLSAEQPVGAATISSWESATHPKLPPKARLRNYARFFATERSVAGDRPVLIPLKELDDIEEVRRQELETELLMLSDNIKRSQVAEPSAKRRSWQFVHGPITIICPEIPVATRGPLSDPRDPNYTAALAYADLDALLELHGHLRAQNPELDVFHKPPSALKPDDLSSHLVVLGGVAWNPASRRLLSYLKQLPVSQAEDKRVPTGEVFVVREGDGHRVPLPTFGDVESGRRELVEDVGLLARMRNPYNSDRSLTICNGIHSRGVMGAVRCLTDKRLRDANENYLAERFPRGDRYAVLLRVQVYEGEALTPDLTDDDTLLYEWPAEEPGTNS